MQTIITITAVDRNSSDSMTRHFDCENEYLLKSMVIEWEKEIPYGKYGLVTQDDIEEFTEEVQEVIDELEISN